MSESATLEAIETVARNSYGQIIAYLASRTGDVADAEDALSDALVAALGFSGGNEPTPGSSKKQNP
jgi:RNA polymerase sigma-70 factor, ECF subfamily